jgi:hypothetical protein
MAAETTTVRVPQPTYREYYPIVATLPGGVLLALWLSDGCPVLAVAPLLLTQ